MESARPEEEKVIKDIRNLFRRGKETKEIKYRIHTGIKNIFEYLTNNIVQQTLTVGLVMSVCLFVTWNWTLSLCLSATERSMLFYKFSLR